MSAILNSLNAHSLPIFLPILMIFVSKFMFHRALSDETYLSLGLLSPLRQKLNKIKRLITGDVILLFVAVFFGYNKYWPDVFMVIYVQEHPPSKHNQSGHYRSSSKTPFEWRFATASGR